MHHFFFIAFSLLAIIGQHVSVQQTTESRSEQIINRGFSSELSVLNGGRWGTWRYRSMCPSGTYTTGFSLRVEKSIVGDDTALNGIRLYCADRSREVSPSNYISSIESDIGYWGQWTDVKWCSSGYLSAFQLRVESPQGAGDDTAANNIRFKCSPGFSLEGDGTSWGYWGDWSPTCKGTGICGLSTKIEGKQGAGDDSALNDVRLYCCD